MTKWQPCQISIEIGCNSQLDRLPKQYPYYLRYLPTNDQSHYLAVLGTLKRLNYQITAHVPARRFSDLQAVEVFITHCTQMGIDRFLLIAGDDKLPKGSLSSVADIVKSMKRSKLTWGSVISPPRPKQTQCQWLANQQVKSTGASFLISQLWYEKHQWQSHWSTQLPWGKCICPPLSSEKFSSLQDKINPQKYPLKSRENYPGCRVPAVQPWLHLISMNKPLEDIQWLTDQLSASYKAL